MNSTANKKTLIHAFNRSAKTCQQVQRFPQEIGYRLLERLSFIKVNPEIILDIGASIGKLTHQLASHYPKAKTMGLDIAKQRLFEAQKRFPEQYICADVENLPLSDLSVDLIFSNLTFHWCSDLFLVFQHIRRCIRPGGLLLFSMLGMDTLQEIRENRPILGDQQIIQEFPDMHHIGDVLLQAGFQDPVTDREYVTLEYPNLQTFLNDLKKSGSVHPTSLKNWGLLGKKRYFEFIQAIEEQNKQNNRLPITFEIIYGYAISKFTVIQESF